MFQGSMLNMERKSDELVNQKIKYYKAFMDYRHMYKLAVLDENIYAVSYTHLDVYKRQNYIRLNYIGYRWHNK